MKVYEKLKIVQSKLKAPKGQYNPFGKYNYRSCEDILEAVKPILAEVNAVIVIRDDLVQIGERYYVKATAVLIDCESSEQVENSAFAREEESKKGMDASQITGSASSYARKYALNGLLCIDDVKDADTGDNSKSEGNKSGSGRQKKSDNKSESSDGNTKISADMINTIKSQVEKYSSKGLKMEKILSMYKISDISDMTISNFKDCMKKLELYNDGGKKK
ncbi:MAG: ERF family protein [Oliverpabstia sp.]